jgi:V/A-type H+-transporting ATPase subunit I
MIEPMKKYTFLVYHKDYKEFLEQLQQKGVVHVVEKAAGEPEDEELAEQYKSITTLKSTIKFLKSRVDNPNFESTEGDGIAILNDVKDIQLSIEKNNQQLSALQKDIDTVKPWGMYQLDNFSKLADAGYQIRFFVCPTRKMADEWYEKYTIETINQFNAQDYFVVISKMDEKIEIDAEEVKLPPKNLSQLETEQQEIKRNQQELNEKLDNIAREYIGTLVFTQQKIEEELSFKKVELSTSEEAEQTLKLLEGWVPVKIEKDFQQFLQTQPVYYQDEKPTPKDKVPILLKNKKFIRLFEPLGDLYALPTYRELDLTPFFAPFYFLFFGFCLGDAGYGLLMLFAGFFKSSKRKQLNPIISLVQWLGAATVLFGIIGGTLFGINLYQSGLPVYTDLRQQFSAQNTDINQILFNLSIVLGAIQIVFGLFIKAANESRQYGFKYSLGTIGWIVLFIGLGLVVYFKKSAFVTEQLAQYLLYGVLGISGILILLLNNPDKNIFFNFGAGLWNTYNMVTGVLGDLLSYIRLFALSISSAILGFVFNSLALQMSPDIPVLRIIVMIIILVAGHGINIFMSGLGAFVHPMRLTFVEFYKNAGFTGGGKKYNPFKKQI